MIPTVPLKLRLEEQIRRACRLEPLARGWCRGDERPGDSRAGGYATHHGIAFLWRWLAHSRMRPVGDQGCGFRPPAAHPVGYQPRRLARAETDCAKRSPKGATESRAGRGRVTMLPEAARNPLGDQIRYARGLYDADRSADAPGVQLSHGLEWKGKKAPTAWEWFWGS